MPGARELIGKAVQAVQAELAELLQAYSNVELLDGRRAVVRNGDLPERQVLTGAGPVPVRFAQGARALGRAGQVQLESGAPRMCADRSASRLRCRGGT